MITKKVISFFTFGVFLIIVGAITNLFNWNQANLILAIGFVFELFALLLFIYQKLKK
jgi:FtsH-binding integral membrane protein